MKVYTVGHSTRSSGVLVAILQEHGVGHLVDVRHYPRSRKNPQFNADVFETTLAQFGIGYNHEVILGGRRPVQADSENTGWDHSAFRGYADYTRSAAFELGIKRLSRVASQVTTCFMCAEAVWWRCHRRMIADAMAVRGWDVLHLGIRSTPVAHSLPSFARVEGTAITYPKGGQ